MWCENAGLAERLEEANVKVTKYCDLCGGFIGVHAMPISRGKIASLAKLKLDKNHFARRASGNSGGEHEIEKSTLEES